MHTHKFTTIELQFKTRRSTVALKLTVLESIQKNNYNHEKNLCININIYCMLSYIYIRNMALTEKTTIN